MRISSSMIFEASTAAMLDQQAALLRTQQQLSTGRRMLTPSDDPVAASQALAVRASESRAEQYAENQATARDALALAESTMGSIGELLTAARTLVVSAGNPTRTNADRGAIATELRGMQAELLGLANAQDGQGRYLFAGYQDGSAPFSQGAAGAVSYDGDQGRRSVAVSDSREIPLPDNGHSIFALGRSGNGVFRTAADAANSGAGIIGVGKVYDATLLTGHAYRIDFAAGVPPTYAVVDVTAATTLSSGNAWASGAAIRFDGIEVSIENPPSGGDRFAVTPSTAQSLFKTLADAIDAVSLQVITPADAARFNTLLGTALTELDLGTERVLTARTAMGAQLAELDGLASAGEAERVLLAERRSRLEDLDYARAMSDLARQQMALEAAQRIHVRVTGMSLFDFLP